MAATVSGIKWQSTGSEMATEGLVTLSGTYATGGVPLTQLALGLSTVNSATFEQGAYTFKYDIANEKLLMYRTAGFTPAGTVASTSTKPTFTVTKGAILASSELGLSADAATGTVNNNTIASTLTLTTNSPVSTPTITSTLTGTAVSAAALVEVAAATSLTGITTNFRAVGY